MKFIFLDEILKPNNLPDCSISALLGSETQMLFEAVTVTVWFCPQGTLDMAH